MSIGPSFDTGILRIRLKAAEDKVKAFESGEKYVRMQEQFKSVFREQNAKIRRLEEELGKAHAETVNVRKIWSEIFDDIYREADAGKFALRKEIARPSGAFSEWNARGMPLWTNCARNCGIKTANYMG